MPCVYGLQCTLIGRPGLPAAPLAARVDNPEVSHARRARFTPLFPKTPQTRVGMATAFLTTLRACRFARVG